MQSPAPVLSVFLVIIVVLLIILLYYFAEKKMQKKDTIKAIAYFNDPEVKGTVLFTENHHDNTVVLDINITGLKPNSLHGFHVHEAGDLTDGCTSACTHFNPSNKLHGCPGSEERHVGDLGNLHSNKNGVAHYSMSDDIIKLRGEANMIGRCLIIHADPDDCGMGNDEESTKTGNAGKRIACTVIGYSKLNFITT